MKQHPAAVARHTLDTSTIMRHLTTLPFLLASFLLAAQDFAPIGARWMYTQGIVSGPDSALAILEVTGDTLIAGRTCARIEATEGWFTCHDHLPYLAEEADTTWYWDQAFGTYRLLFVWSAVPSDTWSTPIATGGGALDTLDWTVLDTGHVTIDGMALRTLDMQVEARHHMAFTPNGGRITQRLGSAIAPFAWAHGPCDAETFKELRCYSDNEIQWQHPRVPGCVLGLPDNTRFDALGARWYVADTYPQATEQEPGFIGTHTMHYYYNGTTTIEGGTWHTLWAQATINMPPPPVMQGHVRQVGEHVLFLDPAGVQHTLYDFSIPMGGTVHYQLPGDLELDLTVIAIDSLLIQDVYHKVIQFDTSDVFISPETRFSDRWIEGMGSIHGPLATHFTNFIEDWPSMDSTRTTCFLQGDTRLWHHPDYTDCAINISNSMEDLHRAAVRIFPNPAADRIQLEGLPPGVQEYKVLDALGRVALQGRSTGSTTTLINVSSLPSGLYLLQLGTPAATHHLLKE